MTLVENKYNESLNKMSGKQRVERTASLYSSFKEMLAIKVKKEFDGISGLDLQKKVAERLYMSDKNVLDLIARVGKS